MRTEADRDEDETTGSGWPRGSTALLVAVGVVYARTAGYALLPGFDDHLYAVGRATVRNWWGVSWTRRLLTPETGYPVPVPTALYAAVQSVWPARFPSVLHATNVGFHLLNTALMFELVRRWEGGRTGLAAAGLWGLHPVAVQSVSWVTGAKTVMFGTGVLVACRLAQADVGRGPDDWSPWRRAGLAGAFLFALGCRPEAGLLAVWLALVVYRHRWSWRDVRRRLSTLGPMLAVGAAWGAVAFRGQNELIRRSDLAATALTDRLIRMAGALEVAARNLVWPLDLQPTYYLFEADWTAVAPGFGIVALWLTATVGTIRAGWRRLAFGLVLTAALYVPYSQLVPIPQLTSDTYLYVPAVGAMTVVVLAGRRLTSALADVAARRRIRRLAVVVSLVVFAGLSWMQVGRWRNNLTLWGPMLERRPNLWAPYIYVARHYTERGRWNEAAAVLSSGYPHFRRTRIYPKILPIAFERAGRPGRAVELALEALERDEQPKPAHYQIFLGLLARHDVALPDRAGTERLLERAVEVYTDREQWMAVRANRLALARTLVERGYHSLARPFLEREFATPRPHCAAWSIAAACERRGGVEIERPDRPSRCREGPSGRSE
ncbi:MAG: tetratricopeptide repeat protein [Bradymonadaceae bacterium]